MTIVSVRFLNTVQPNSDTGYQMTLELRHLNERRRMCAA